MASKRQLSSSGDGAGPSRPSKCPRSTPSSSQNTTGLTRQDMVALLTEKDREIEKLHAENKKLKEILSTFQATSEHADDGLYQYEIRILGTIKERIYTDFDVEGEDGKLLKAVILYNGNKVTWEPFASAKFEIVVVKGNFCGIDHKVWSAEEFRESLVEAQKQARSILAGNCRSKFSDAEAVLTGLQFKDSSRGAEWLLGIRVLGSFTIRVLEAISQPFKVLDCRSKGNEKPHTPLLTDPVEGLKKVGMKRAPGLRDKKVFTIKDFLQFFHLNPSGLLQILGINSESDKSWDTMTKHAKECKVGPKHYYYRKNNNKIIFNPVYEVVGAEFGNHYKSFDTLLDDEKELVNKLKKVFFENIKKGDFTADFRTVNRQDVLIEHYDDALRYDQTVGLQVIQPSDTTSFSDASHQMSQIYIQTPPLNEADTIEVLNIIHDQTAGLLATQPSDTTSFSDAFQQILQTDSQFASPPNEADTIEVPNIISAEPNNAKAGKRLMLVVFVVLSTKNLIKRVHLTRMSRILNFVRAELCFHG